MYAHKSGFGHMLSSTSSSGAHWVHIPATRDSSCTDPKCHTAHGLASHMSCQYSHTRSTWHCQFANDAHQVGMQISFMGICSAKSPHVEVVQPPDPNEVTCMQSTLQMCEILPLLWYMQNDVDSDTLQHIAELTIACCPTLNDYCTSPSAFTASKTCRSDTISFNSPLCTLHYTQTLLSSFNSTCRLTSTILQATKYQLCSKTHYNSGLLWTPPVRFKRGFCPFQEAIYASPFRGAYAIVTYSMPAGACSDATSMFLAPLKTEDVIAPVGPPSLSCWRGASRGLCISSSDMVKNWASTMHMSDFIKYTRDRACHMQL